MLNFLIGKKIKFLSFLRPFFPSLEKLIIENIIQKETLRLEKKVSF
jgi:hypothetical protein